MALPSSGPLTLANIQTEFGGTNPVGLSEYYRGGPYVPDSTQTTTIPASGLIAVNNFYGTSKRVPIPLTISSNTYNYDVYTNRGPAYVAGVSDITVTVSPSILVGSTSAAAYSMLVPNTFDSGDTVTIVNNGVIQGMGGGGGASRIGASPGPPGAIGGNALYVNRPTTIENNSVVAGGGGGGGAGGGGQDDKGPARVGGGGGGGDAAPGGPGGGRGSNGSNGGNSGGANPRPGGAGGTGGSYLVGNPFVTWTATGTRQGSVS